MSSYKLREIQADDKDRILSWRNQGYVRNSMYSNAVIENSGHSRWFEKALLQQNGVYHILEYLNKPIGFIGITDINKENMKASWTFYIGDRNIAPEGSGYVLCSLMLDKFFNEMQFELLEAEVIEFNSKSSILHKKLGFKECDVDKPLYNRDGKTYKINYFSLTKEEWKKNR